MGSVNKVILVGNLGRDAELRYTPGGAAVSKFSLATTEVWNDKSGQRQERTEWHNIDLWGKQAESLSEYLVKGKQVYIEGRLQTDEYTDKEGVKRTSASRPRLPTRITLFTLPIVESPFGNWCVTVSAREVPADAAARQLPRRCPDNS